MQPSGIVNLLARAHAWHDESSPDTQDADPRLARQLQVSADAHTWLSRAARHNDPDHPERYRVSVPPGGHLAALSQERQKMTEEGLRCVASGGSMQQARDAIYSIAPERESETDHDVRQEAHARVCQEFRTVYRLADGRAKLMSNAGQNGRADPGRRPLQSFEPGGPQSTPSRASLDPVIRHMQGHTHGSRFVSTTPDPGALKKSGDHNMLRIAGNRDNHVYEFRVPRALLLDVAGLMQQLGIPHPSEQSEAFIEQHGLSASLLEQDNLYHGDGLADYLVGETPNRPTPLTREAAARCPAWLLHVLKGALEPEPSAPQADTQAPGPA